MNTISKRSVTVATATLTSDNTNVAATDTVTIGTKVYTFTATPAVEGDVDIGGTADDTLNNLVKAINHDATNHTEYWCAEANADVTAAARVGHTVTITVKMAGTVTTSTYSAGTAHLSWSTTTSVTTECGDVVFVGEVDDTTLAAAAQQVTVGDFPTGNANWCRAMRLSSQAMMCLRAGVPGVAMLLTTFRDMALSVEPTLTYVPLVTTDPDDYAAVFAKATLTDASVLPSDTNTVVIGSKTYTFNTSLGGEGSVLIDAVGADTPAKIYNTLSNLKAAIDHGTGSGSKYNCAAAHTLVKGGALTATATGATLQIISLIIGSTVPNAYATTVGGGVTAVAWGGTTMAGGTAAPTFTAAAESELTKSYQWQEYTSAWANVTDGGIYGGATTVTLTITPTTTGQTGYQYRCVITNAAGSSNTEAATLTVT